MTTRRLAAGRLDAAALDALHGRSMLLTQDWTTPEIEALCTLAETLQAARPRRAACPPLFAAAAVLGPVLRQLHAHQVVLGRRGGAVRRPARHRGRLVHPGQPRRDVRGDRRDAGHERPRPGHPPRPDPGRGQPLHARRQAGHRRLPRGDRRRARRAAWSTSSATSTTPPRRSRTCCGCGSASRTASPAARSRCAGRTRRATPSRSPWRRAWSR